MSNHVSTQGAAGRSALGTAIVTGASSGIGKVYAEQLAHKGYDLTLVARRGDRLDAMATDLARRFGVAVHAMVADLGQQADLERVAATAAADSSVTLLVNNAGTNRAAPVPQLDPKDLRVMIDLNVTAVSRLTTAVLPGFLARKRGGIVNVGSVLGFHGYPYTAVYSGTKAYVMNFTRSLQAELAGTGVVVQLVAPASTVSELWDVQGFPITNVDAATVMTAENCVSASLRRLELGEHTTLPSLADAKLLADFDAASSALFAAAQSGTPALRYAGAR